MDQSGQANIASGAGLVDLQAVLALRRYLAERRHEPLLLNPLDQLSGLEAAATRMLPQAFRLIDTQIPAR